MSNAIFDILENEGLTYYPDEFHNAVIEFTDDEYRYWVRSNKVTFRKLTTPPLVPSTSITFCKYEYSLGKHGNIINQIVNILIAEKREAE